MSARPGRPAWQRWAWPALLALVVVLVASDFVRHPFRPFGPQADASGRPTGLRLSITGTEAGDPVGAMSRSLAAALNARGTAADGGRTVAERLQGATTTAVESVLGVGDGSRHRLLVLTPQTLVQLQQDRGETIVPGVAVRAERAWGRLLAARPVALVAADPLTLEVRPDSPLRTIEGLAASLRRSPESKVFGVGLDSWSRAALATLVRDARVEGTVSYRSFLSARDAAAAVADGDAQVVVGTRGAAEGVDPVDRLRPLTGPWPGAVAPARWIAVVAPASTPPGELARLRRRLRGVVRSPAWARTLRGQGLVAPDPGVAVGPFLVRERARTGELSATLASVDLSVRR
jgi:hypothetical protein